MGRIVTDYDFTDLGLKTLECRPGDKLKTADYYETVNSGTLNLTVELEKPLLKVDSKLGICVDIDSDNKLITIAEVVKEERTPTFMYVYTLDIPGVGIATSSVVTIGETTQADIIKIILLDYDHIWEKSETPDGNREYLQYFFDNTTTTNSNGDDIFDNSTPLGLSSRRTYYEGNATGYSGTMFKSTTYPIIDFFHEEFIHVIENKSMVWMRRRGGGGLDRLTWKGYNAGSAGSKQQWSKNPLKTESVTNSTGEYTIIPDTEVVVPAAREKEPIKEEVSTKNWKVVDETAVQRTSDIIWQPTMAKFVGWPHCKEETIVGGAIKFSEATPFYFLKPALDIDGNSLSSWDADSPEIYPKTSFYINGAHAIPEWENASTINGMTRTGAVNVEGKYYQWTTISPEKITKTSSVYWVPNAQEVAGFGAKFIPGDGNEFYNVKFWRNDGDSFAPAMSINSRQGLRFDRCEFLSIWDGYTYDYIGSTEMAEALVIENNSYDNIFENCTFEVKTAQKEVIYGVKFIGDSAGNITTDVEFKADNQIFGKREKRAGGKYNGGLVTDHGKEPIGDQKIGYISAVLVEDSGNIKFDNCKFNANFGQTCLISDNADNIEILGSRAETYYHNTEVLYSKHGPSNTTSYDVNNYYNAKTDYEGALTLYDVFINMFGSEVDIIQAHGEGNSAYANPYMNGDKGEYSWTTIQAAKSSLDDKSTKGDKFETESGLMPFKISERYEIKPKGFWFKNQSSSVLVKGTEFFGEGIGFFADNCTNRHYLEFENNRVDTYIDEAYLFRNVNYPKLRDCWGHTIAHSVFRFESCLKPVQYNCEAESDTGFGYEFIKAEPTPYLSEPFPTDMWRVYDCHVYSGSGLEYDPKSMPAKIDFGTFIQTANSTQDTYVLPESEGIERSLVGIKLYDSPYKAAFRNLYFKNINNDIDIYKGDNVELYLENAHFAANREIHGTYSSPAYFIHKGFSGVWEYRDIGGSITTSAVQKQKNDLILKDTNAGFSLAFKSHVNNPLGRSTVVLGNSNDETQYLDLVQGLNKITVYMMARLLDVEKPLTNQDIWLELRYKDRAPGDPHVTTSSTRGDYRNVERIVEDTDHRGMWLINGQVVPNAKEFKIEMIVDAGQDCSCPLSICYEYFTTVGEIYIDPYARVVQLDADTGEELG